MYHCLLTIVANDAHGTPTTMTTTEHCFDTIQDQQRFATAVFMKYQGVGDMHAYCVEYQTGE